MLSGPPRRCRRDQGYLSSTLLLPPILLCLLSLSGQALALDPSKSNWRVFWANDDFLGNDNQFTNGISVTENSALASSLAATSGTLAFGKTLAKLILPNRGDLHYRETWSVAQNLQTPDEDGLDEIILDDLPYVGMLGWTNTYAAFNNRELTAFQTLIGAVGEITLGEQAQTTAHKISGASDPEGWENQLDNEPLLNVYVMKKYKFHDRPRFDASVNFGAALGNFFTFGSTALEFRYGRRPGGFAPVPVPMGHGIDVDARISRAGQTYLYSSLVVRGRGFLFAMPRDGNLLRRNNEWTEDNVIDPRDVIGELILGFHLERQSWGAHLNFAFSTDTVKNADDTAVANPKNNYASLNFEWQF